MTADVFRFDSEFQRKLVKLALEDDSFATQAIKYVAPEMFESDALRWVWQQMVRQREIGRSPTVLVIRDLLRDVNPVLQPRYRAMVTALQQDVIREEAFIRARLSEFIQRNIFVAAFQESKRLYNMGQFDAAVDLMRKETQKAQAVTFDVPDRGWFFSELDARERMRRREAEHNFDYTFGTGITRLDLLLDGGLSRGELGTWIADSKGGKSLFLVHLTAYPIRAERKKVLAIVLEGSRKMFENRIETLFSGGLAYRTIKHGEMDAFTYRRLSEEYHDLRDCLVVRAFTNAWNYNVGDIQAELDDLRQSCGWIPDMLTVDYGDLLRAQYKAQSEEEHQRQAFSDLKTLTTRGRGYAIWTASQSKRPSVKREDIKAGIEFKKYVIKAKDVSDSYNKIRRSDFIGSINRDKEDKANKEVRLWCDMYRDNEAEVLITLRQDLPHMMFVDLMDVRNRPDSPEAIADEETKRRMQEVNSQFAGGGAKP